MTVRYKFEQLVTTFTVGLVVGLVIGTHLYTLFTGG